MTTNKDNTYEISVRLTRTIQAMSSSEAKAAARLMFASMEDNAAFDHYEIDDESLQWELVEEDG